MGGSARTGVRRHSNLRTRTPSSSPRLLKIHFILGTQEQDVSLPKTQGAARVLLSLCDVPRVLVFIQRRQRSWWRPAASIRTSSKHKLDEDGHVLLGVIGEAGHLIRVDVGRTVSPTNIRHNVVIPACVL